MGKSSGGIRERKSGYNPAIEDYISGNGMWINSWLRNNTFELTNEEERYLKQLDKSTNKAISKNTILYRSVDASAVFGSISQADYESLLGVLVYQDKQKYNLDIANKLISNAKSKRVIEKGFMSTTKSAKIAEEWGGFTGSSKPIIMRIKTPSGVKGIDLSKHRMAQKEVLLQRGLKYKVAKIFGKNGHIYIDINII